VVMGIAASAAALLASAGGTRLISPTAQMMIHEASAGAFGSVSSMQETVEQIAKQQEIMVSMLAKNCKQTSESIKDAINKKDKYFNAQEAVSFGLVDRVINDQEAQALKLSEGINVEGYEITGKEIQILREGRYSHPIYGDINITVAVLETMKKNFENNVRGQDISIDYTHDNENGESPAAFWIKALEVRLNTDKKGMGLFARGEFTPKGAKLVSEKEYKYSSADFVIDYIDQGGKHNPYVLRGGTLTNRPFIKNMNPIKLSEFQQEKKEIKQMNQEELIAALKALGIDVTSLMSSSESLGAQVKALEAKIAELNALPVQKEAEIKALKDALAEANTKIVDAEKMKAFNSLVAEGKCVPAQKEQVISAFKTADEISAFYKNAPAVVAVKPAGSSGEGEDETLTAEEKLLIESGEYTKEQIMSGRSPVKKEPTAKV
jgi:phage I-like protein